MRIMKHPLLTLGVVAVLGQAVFGPTTAPAQEAQIAPADQAIDDETVAALARIRSATEKYEDVEIALADGYLRDPTYMCAIPSEEGLPDELGAMGIHFFRPDLLQITAMGPRVAGSGINTDFTQPAVLVYYPDATGALKLGAIENLVFEGAWKAAGNAGPPEFHGRPYVHRSDDPATADIDEAHMFEPHYELHIWMYEDNPSGMFTPYNPAVSCEHHDGPTTMAEAMAYMQAHAAPPEAGATTD